MSARDPCAIQAPAATVVAEWHTELNSPFPEGFTAPVGFLVSVR
jgi:hypothetical protein